MKKKWFLGIMAAVLLLSSGCGNETGKEATNDADNAPIVIDSETIGVSDDDTPEETNPVKEEKNYDFKQSVKLIFPLVEGYKWLYTGSVEYASIECLSKIDMQHPEVTEIYIEGVIEDVSGLYRTDLSYLKQYSIFDDQLIRKFGPYESVVLKSPVNKDESWENIYFDQVYGLFDARYTVSEASENMVKVKIEPVSPEKDGVPKHLKIETTYEIGKGITMEQRVYVYDDDGVEQDYEHGYGLYKTSETDDIAFMSRYFSKDPYISSIYHKGYFDYAIREATAYQYLYENRFRLTDQLVSEAYKKFVETLDKEDIRTISTAENVLDIYSEEMEKPEILIGFFLEHYENVIENNQFILADWFEEGELESISGYDIEENEFKISDEFWNDEEVQGKLLLINDNGMAYYFENDIPVIKPSSDYLTDRLYYLSDIPMQSYLTLLQQAYSKMPYYRDGLNTLTLDELQKFILEFESFKLGYEGAYIGDASAKWGTVFLHQYLKPSSMVYWMENGPKEIHPETLVHYKKTLQQLKDPQTASILSMTIELIEKNNNYYSKELNDFLFQLGVEVPPSAE